jgi:hypothetical protein
VVEVVDHVRSMGVTQDMFVMLCGQMTLAQRKIAQKRAQLDTEIYRSVLNHFIKESGHLGYAWFAMPENFPSQVFVEDKETENNTDREMNGGIEKTLESRTYYFSTAQDPSDKTSVYANSKKLHGRQRETIGSRSGVDCVGAIGRRCTRSVLVT